VVLTTLETSGLVFVFIVTSLVADHVCSFVFYDVGPVLTNTLFDEAAQGYGSRILEDQASRAFFWNQEPL
jgi:hypothetical protein